MSAYVRANVPLAFGLVQTPNPYTDHTVFASYLRLAVLVTMTSMLKVADGVISLTVEPVTAQERAQARDHCRHPVCRLLAQGLDAVRAEVAYDSTPPEPRVLQP